MCVCRGGALGSESSAEERNKCINNKEDMTSGGGAVQRFGWVYASMEESDCTHIRVRESVYSMNVRRSIVPSLRKDSCGV